MPPDSYGAPPGYPPPPGDEPGDRRDEAGKDKGSFNPMNMMNKMPNPMKMFGSGKE